MAGFYNVPKDGAKFSSVAFTDMTSVNSEIKFDELRFIADDDFYHLYLNAHKFTDLVKVGDKDWKFTEQLTSFKIARKNYEKWSQKDQKKLPVEQSRVEKLVCKIFDNLDPAVTYTGFLQLQDGNGIDAILTGVMNGRDVSEMVPTLLETYGSFEVGTADKITDADVVAPKKSGGSYGAKAQTEFEKLNDRLSFIKTQIGLCGCDFKVETVYDISPEAIKTGSPTPETASIIRAIVAMSFELMK